MNFCIRIARSISQLGAWFAGSLLLLSCIAVGVEVFLRKTFNISMQNVDEMIGYALAFSGAWGFAFTLIQKAHIRIDVLTDLLPLQWRAVFDILGLSFLIVFFGTLTWYGWKMVTKTFVLGARSMSPLNTPLIIPQGIWIIGLSVFVLVAIVLLIAAVKALLRSDVQTIQQLIGARSAQEEALEEKIEATVRLSGAREARK